MLQRFNQILLIQRIFTMILFDQDILAYAANMNQIKKCVDIIEQSEILTQRQTAR